jgi:hypothetical protein
MNLQKYRYRFFFSQYLNFFPSFELAPRFRSQSLRLPQPAAQPKNFKTYSNKKKKKKKKTMAIAEGGVYRRGAIDLAGQPGGPGRQGHQASQWHIIGSKGHPSDCRRGTGI